MVLPEKFSTLKVDELRAECDLRKIPHTGLTKEQMKTQIIEYEEDLARQPKEENVNEESGEESEIEEEGSDKESKSDKLSLRKLELKKYELELKTRELQLNHEFRMKKLELEAASSQNNSSKDKVLVESRTLKIPYLRDEDDIETYLCTFERIAVANKWKEDTWATRVVPLLTGKAREAYVRMNIEDSDNYTLLKKAIMLRYDLTPENYRKQFRSCRKAPDKTFVEWGIRAKKLFRRWVGTAIDDPFILSELIVMEQILNNTTPELQVWLKEHEARTVDELTKYAETYRSVRQGAFRRTDFKTEKFRYERGKKDYSKSDSKNNQPESVETKKSFSKNERSKFVTCFKCKKRGHYQSDCPENVKKETTGYCHSPTRLASSFDSFTESGYINDKPVKMIIDTGSSCTLVHHDFVPEKMYSGQTMDVQFADGSQKQIPLQL